jgi:DNA-3-methyladenine glycosylase
MKTCVLLKKFYKRDTANVAQDLLGKILVRKINDKILTGLIVETEAYYGRKDPSSRAFQGKKSFNLAMWGEPGIIFIYNVHKYWMLNFIAHKQNKVGGVLIRALEPINGIEIMKKNRNMKDLIKLTNGPGKLTIALEIDKGYNLIDATKENSVLHVLDNKFDFEIGNTHRIGVKKDLREKLRFFIKDNKFISRRAN